MADVCWNINFNSDDELYTSGLNRIGDDPN